MSTRLRILLLWLPRPCVFLDLYRLARSWKDRNRLQSLAFAWVCECAGRARIRSILRYDARDVREMP